MLTAVMIFRGRSGVTLVTHITQRNRWHAKDVCAHLRSSHLFCYFWYSVLVEK